MIEGLKRLFGIDARRSSQRRFDSGFMYVWHEHFGDKRKPLSDLMAEVDRAFNPNEFELGMQAALQVIALAERDRAPVSRLDENRVTALHYRSALETIAEGQNCDPQVLARHTLDYVALRLRRA